VVEITLDIVRDEHHNDVSDFGSVVRRVDGQAVGLGLGNCSWSVFSDDHVEPALLEVQ